MLPVVAIVGRPNVGKSTLFNRLTRTRDALTTSFPGTTRDRQFGDVTLENRHFIIIDTGGIKEESQNHEREDDIQQHITKQALQAINEADKVLFLIDGRQGLTVQDREIANLLRRSGKSLLLVVNKAEGLNPDICTAEANELGLGLPICISAEHGLGITQLIEALFPNHPNPIVEAVNINENEMQGIQLAIVGRPNVGKSTLTNRMLGEERVIVHDSPGTTRDSIFIPLQRLGQHYTLIDTAGVRKRKKVTEAPEKFSIVKTLQAIENANVVLYIVDANLGVSDQDLKLIGFILDCGKALVIAVNKWDGLSDSTRNHTRASIDRHLDFVKFARVHYISALHGSGVGNLFDSATEAYASATKKIATPLLNQLLQKAQTVHQPPLVHGRRVKLRYAHVGGHNPPCIVIHGNQVQALPDSYKKFLAHFFQKKLKLVGTPVLIEFKSGKNPFNP